MFKFGTQHPLHDLRKSLSSDTDARTSREGLNIPTSQLLHNSQPLTPMLQRSPAGCDIPSSASSYWSPNGASPLRRTSTLRWIKTRRNHWFFKHLPHRVSTYIMCQPQPSNSNGHPTTRCPQMPYTDRQNCGLPAPTATDYVRKLKSLPPASVLYIYMARYSRNIRASILQNGCAKTNPHVLFFGRDF